MPSQSVSNRAMAELLRLPGVEAALWSRGPQGTGQEEEDVLCLRVQETSPSLDRLLSAFRVAGITFLETIRIDRVVTGPISSHQLDASDRIDHRFQNGSTLTGGTVSAVALVDGFLLALLSGHASLPRRNGRILRYYEHNETPEYWNGLVARGAPGEEGVSLRGRIDHDQDWALAQFRASEYALRHPIADHSPPLIIFRGTPYRGMPVRMWSAVEGKEMQGRVSSYSPSAIHADLKDGSSTHTYYGVLEVTSGDEGEPFSQPGDSGSLVFDGQGRVIGALIAGTAHYSYVLPVNSMQGSMGLTFNDFFR